MDEERFKKIAEKYKRYQPKGLKKSKVLCLI